MLSATPQLLIDTGVSSDPKQFTAVDNVVFFTADSPAAGRELWRTDGTPAGTMLVADIAPGGQDTGSLHLTEFNGKLVYASDDGSTGIEPWISDGTVAGTMQIKDINPSGDSLLYSNVYWYLPPFTGAPFTEFQGDLYFAADDGTLGSELWKTDGTETGTVLVKDINPNGFSIPGGYEFPQPLYSFFNSGFVESGGSLFFGANTETEGFELWKTDGTELGTVLVKDIRPGYDPSGISLEYTDIWGSTDVNGTLFFVANGGENDFELWKSDGSEAGTVRVKDINPGDDVSSYPIQLTAVEDTLFFFAIDDTEDFHFDLWKSDGTEAGTVLVKEFSGGVYPYQIVASDGMLFFTFDDGTNGIELWQSDGTEVGTVMVADIAPGATSSNPYYLTAVSGGVVFSASDGVSGRELWASDGTSEGTYMVVDLQAGGNSSNPNDLTYVDGKLYFSASGGNNGRQPWVVDLVITPTADIGGPYSGDEGTLIALSGAGSTGATLYEWDLDNDGQYDDATGENVDFDAMDDGVFTIGLRINGVGGPTDSTTVTVNNLAPTASITGTTDIYRGEEVTFTLTATDASPVDQAGLFDFEIDWDGDGSVDETLFAVPSGTTVQHKFSTIAANNIQVRATDKDSATGSFAQTPITVSPHVLRDDGFGNIDLIWGGTDLLDAVYVIGGGPSVSLFVQFEGLQFVNRLDAIGTGVTGKVILHGYAAADVLIGEFSTHHVVEIHGGDGDDVIVGGFLGDELFGDGGNDVILGGTQLTDGDDMLFGGEGKDTIFGHLGADTLDGGGGEDLLISDRFGFSNIAQDVQRIGNEWKSARPYAERVTNILGITSTGVNGTSILGANVTIAEDNAQDVLIGGLGDMDWFFYDFDEDLLGDVIELDEEETDSNP